MWEISRNVNAPKGTATTSYFSINPQTSTDHINSLALPKHLRKTTGGRFGGKVSKTAASTVKLWASAGNAAA
jgi:predicted secreted Zn-dependent protease